MRHLDKMAPQRLEWKVDERSHEINYHRADGECITIDFWQVDKALCDGQWVQL